MDIALATEARGMYSKLLTGEDRERISQMRSTQELVRFLMRSEAWHDAALMLQSGDLTDARFSEAVGRCVYADFEKLYRFANDTSRQFLNFITLDTELQAIMRTLRRLIYPASDDAESQDALPPLFRNLPGHSLEKLRRARSFEEVSAAVSGGIYARALASLELDEKTGLPSLSGAVTALELRFFDALAEYMHTGYTGPAKEELEQAVNFRADMLNIAYLMRLRRFGAPPEQAGKQLLPLHGSVTAAVCRRALEASDDWEAFSVLRSTKSGKRLPEDLSGSPEAAIRTAQAAYFRKLLHGKLNLAVVYAFITLKEYEAEMLRRAFMALQYGLSPAEFMD